MVSYRTISLYLLLVAAPLFLFTPYSQQPAPTSGAPKAPDVIKIGFNVIDRYGKVISELAPSDIQVLDDGKPQPILSLDATNQRPLSIALLIDTSVSQGRLQTIAKLVARGFVETVLRTGQDQVAIIGFTGKLTAEQELTIDMQKAIEAIARVRFATLNSYAAGVIVTGSGEPDKELIRSGSTAIWDTVWNVSEGLSVSSTESTRRAILLLTDGVDTFSGKSIDEVATHATKREVTVYAIGMADKGYNNVDEGALKKLTTKTGGWAFFPKKIPELPAVYAQLADALRSEYVVTYLRPQGKPNDLSRIKIQVVSPALKGAKITYQRAL